jgi:hypothetical protein
VLNTSRCMATPRTVGQYRGVRVGRVENLVDGR